jgi:hypothetical protein
MASRTRYIANQSEAPQVTALNCLTLNDNGHQIMTAQQDEVDQLTRWQDAWS